MARSETIGKYTIHFDEVYYLAYAGGTRDLPDKDKKEYQKVQSIPWGLARQKELAKFPKEKNPNVIPMTGMKLMSFIKELNFVPIFDTFFEHTHLLKLTDIIIYESIKQKNYEIARG